MSGIKAIHRLFAGSRSDIIRQKDAALIRTVLDVFDSPYKSNSSQEDSGPSKAGSTKLGGVRLTPSEEQTFKNYLKRTIDEGVTPTEELNTTSINKQIATMGQALHDVLVAEGDPLTAERNSAALYDRVHRYYWTPQGSSTRAATRGLGMAFGAGDTSFDTARRILEAQGREGELEARAPSAYSLAAVPEALQLHRTEPTEPSTPPSSSSSSGAATAAAPAVSKQRLRELAGARLGFSLEARPSSIDHENAGMGLYLRGAARRGQLLGFYPGVVFLPQWHHYVPGFPCPDLENVYLLGRYDRALIDGKSWGQGAQDQDPSQVQPITWDSTFFDTENMGPIFDATRNYMAKRSMGWEALKDRYWDIKYDWRFVDLRNPYAAFHFANHPPKNALPNVLKVPFEFDPTAEGFPKWLRAHVPFLMYQAGAELTREGKDAKPHVDSLLRVPYKGGTVRGMAVIAARDLADQEELFMDYRLNMTMISGRPGWYSPVSSDAQWRWQFHSVVGLGGALGIREDVDDLAERLKYTDELAAKKRWIL